MGPGSRGEHRCLEAMRAILDGEESTKYFSDPLVIGPGLVQALSGSQTAFGVGRPFLTMHRDVGLYFLGRLFHAVDGTLDSFLGCPELRSLLGTLVDGGVRSPTRDEIGILETLVPYAVDSASVVVVQAGRHCLLLNLHRNRVIWLDMVSEYPLRSVADTMKEAMRRTKEVGERAVGATQ